MSLRKSKNWYSNNCLHFLKFAVPLQIWKILKVFLQGQGAKAWLSKRPSYNSLARVERFQENLITFSQHFSGLQRLLQEKSFML